MISYFAVVAITLAYRFAVVAYDFALDWPTLPANRRVVTTCHLATYAVLFVWTLSALWVRVAWPQLWCVVS